MNDENLEPGTTTAASTTAKNPKYIVIKESRRDRRARERKEAKKAAKGNAQIY